VPLLIRGPGITPGTVSDELVANVDLAPTILEAARTTADRPLDGRSLLPFARDGLLRSRRPVLHEGLQAGDIDRDGAATGGTVGEYHAIRTGRYLYVEWINGARELYDRARDPRELQSRDADPRYRRIRNSLHRELVRLRTCVGDVCRAPLGPLGG
jgi:arylsulfatase A-like enzyme